jgi:hypothetical protein
MNFPETFQISIPPARSDERRKHNDIAGYWLSRQRLGRLPPESFIHCFIHRWKNFSAFGRELRSRGFGVLPSVEHVRASWDNLRKSSGNCPELGALAA